MPDGKTLLTTDHGGWALLDPRELEQLRGKKPGKPLAAKLEGAGIILSGRGRKKAGERLGKRFGFLFNGTSLHIINPTLRCNQSCVYCYADAKPAAAGCGQDMSRETAEKIVDFIFQSPAKSITIEFQGGEPLLRFDLIRFIFGKAKEKNKAAGKRILWNIVTNLSMMDGEKARFLERNRFGICTSLDGPEGLHMKNRPFLCNGSYGQVVGWVKRFRADFNIGHIGMLPTITRQSLGHAKELVGLYASLGAQDIRPVLLRRVGRAAKNWKKIGYSPEQYLRFWKQVVEECIERTRRGEFICETTAMLVLLKILGKRFPNYTCFSMPCGAALMQSAYAPNGDIFTCDEGKAMELFRLGNVWEDDYKAVYLSPNAMNIVQLSSGFLLPCNDCPWHAYCGCCPVVAYASQGNPLAKLPLDFDCRVKKGQIGFVFEKLFSKDRDVLLQWAEKGKL